MISTVESVDRAKQYLELNGKRGLPLLGSIEEWLRNITKDYKEELSRKAKDIAYMCRLLRRGND